MAQEKVSPWMSSKELVEKLKIGDLVEFERTSKIGIKLYSHWGVYIGTKNGMYGICHLTNGEDVDKDLGGSSGSFTSGFGGQGGKALVRLDDIFDITSSDSKCRINNSLDEYYDPLPGNVICLRVKYRLGDYGYNLFYNNCEHFAKWARYNLATSMQAKIGKAIIYGVWVYGMSACPITGLTAGGLSYLGLEGYDVVRKLFPVEACLKNWIGKK